ncbi:hypothetical protein [Adlercreutzia sp. ZJ141]|uniref:hypothetical protein n=1 Tax=Adlercreutzia sp. ZJ141 TaxID=2709406 RepID=UPI0013EAE2A2|nr:hypothetical protein [Adlercreutzia sp. ZJ141]
MIKPTREKIALAVFALGMVGALAAAAAYLVIGHSWNIAASHIDYTIDALDEFDVVVYEGLSATQARVLQDEGEASPYQLQPGSRRFSRAEAERVAESYRKAGSSVLLLDIDHPRKYADGLILLRDGVRFGVLSVSEMDTKQQIAEKVDYLRSAGVRMVVALVPYKSVLGDVAGIDVAICLKDRIGLFPEGKTINGTTFVSPASQGSTGVVLMSSSNVVLVKSLPYDM